MRTPAPISCQVRTGRFPCSGTLTDDEALESLREFGQALCALHAAEERDLALADDRSDADRDR